MESFRSKLEAGSSTWEAGKAVQGGGCQTSIPEYPQEIGLLVPKKKLPKEDEDEEEEEEEEGF